MTEITVTSTAADAEALERIRSAHADLTGALLARTANLAREAEGPQRDGAEATRLALARFAGDQLVAAIEAEIAAAPAHPAPLHAMAPVLQRQISAVAGASGTSQALLAAGGLRAGWEAWTALIEATLLPGLATGHGAALARTAAALAEILAAPAAGTPTEELDARAIPHHLRHATIFSALEGIAAGQALVLIAPHDPIPLLAQLEQRRPGAFEVSYLERGPHAWRLCLERVR